MVGKTAVAGYGEAGKGCAGNLRSLGAHVVIAELDPYEESTRPQRVVVVIVVVN